MMPICDMHLPDEVKMDKIPGRTTFAFQTPLTPPGEFYFDDVYRCASCNRYYHQKLGYTHAPTQQNNRNTPTCRCEENRFHRMAVAKVGDDPDTVILGCVVCDRLPTQCPSKTH